MTAPDTTGQTGELDNILLSYGRHIVQSEHPENFGKDARFLSVAEAKAALLSWHTAVCERAIPEKLTKPPEDCEGKDYAIGIMAGYNKAVSDMRANLARPLEPGGGE